MLHFTFSHDKKFYFGASKGNEEANKVLFDNRVVLLMRTCRELFVIGSDIDKDTGLLVVNNILSEKIIFFVPSKTRGFMIQNIQKIMIFSH